MNYLSICLTFVVAFPVVSSRPASLCGGKAADVVFIVDTSSSIWPPNFSGHMIPFVRNVVNMFDIGPSLTQTRVGMVTFGDEVHHRFHLNTFMTKEAVAAAIDETKLKGGNTFTNKAVDYVRDKMFTKEHGARDDVVQIIVIITDGASDEPRMTKASVEAAKSQGIQIFAVGVGYKVRYRELKEMASDPKEDFMFHVKGFQGLHGIQQKLAIKTCLVTAIPTTVPTTTPTTTTTTITQTTTTTSTTTTVPTTTTEPTTASTTNEETTTTTVASTIISTTPTTSTTTTTVPKANDLEEELPQGDQGYPDSEKDCEKIPADVFFILDVSSSLWQFHFNKKVLPFVQKLVKTFDIGPSQTRVGIVTFADNITPVFGLDDYSSSEELIKAINPTNIKYTGERKTNTALALKYVRQKGLAPGVARKDVDQIVIVVTDGRSVDPTQTEEEAKAMKQAGLYMFAVGVGSSVDPTEMKNIGSEPEERFVFKVDTYEALTGVSDMLAEETCNLKASRTHKTCNIQDTDLTFVFESASKSPGSRIIMRSVITDFANNLREEASNVLVGSVTDPCPAEDEISFLSLAAFRKKVSTIVEKKESKMHRLMKKLRLETFTSGKTEKGGDSRKVGVIFLDNMTVAPSKVVREAERLRSKGVELYVVAVGDVSEYLVMGVASRASHVIRLDSYSRLKSQKLDKLWNICA